MGVLRQLLRAGGIVGLIVAVVLAAPATQGTSESAPADPLSFAMQPWTGDYDGMVERRMIRILVPYSHTHYFLDGATARGMVAATGRRLGESVNQQEALRTRPLAMVFIPTPRNKLIERLVEGVGDIAAGNLGVSAERAALVDFTEPVFRNVREVIVTGPDSPALSRLDDLAGRYVYAQPDSAHWDSLERLNESLTDRGLAPVRINALNPRLEAGEIAELVDSGVVTVTLMDQHLADFWAQIHPEMVVHADLVVAEGRDIAWAFRQDSPQLAAVLNLFVRGHRHRTEFGNIIFRRYLQNLNGVHHPGGSADLGRYLQLRPLFDQYGAEYGIDPLLLAALAYQESRLDQSVRSPVGAIGVMQLMPVTGDSLGVGDIHDVESNIHGGARYLRQLLDLFDSEDVEELDEILFALAAYNGGQTRLRRLRRETGEQGMDPNQWFDNVEMRSARVIGRENVQYVRNIYKYYLAYQLIEQKREQRRQTAISGQVTPSQ